MKLKFSLLFFLLSFTVISFAQLNQEQRNNLTIEDMHFLDGLFMVEYDGVNHKIELFASDELFVEFDSNGNEIGNGTFYKNDNEFVFVPIQFSSESFIVKSIIVKILEINLNNISVIAEDIESGSGAVINMIKL